MALRINYILTRALLILLCFQFSVQAYAYDLQEGSNAHNQKIAFVKQISHNNWSSILYEKEEKESEEEDHAFFFLVELLDFKAIYSQRILASQFPASSFDDAICALTPARCKLFCVFLI